MSSIVVVAPLKYGAHAEARSLVEAGPPFDPERTPLVRHQVFLSSNEVIFVFEGENPRGAVQDLIGEAGVWQAALAWRRCLAGRPRIADPAFEWTRTAVHAPAA